MVRHAMDPAEKQVRREEILGAARELLLGGDGALPGVAQIAGAAGLAKGTVYLYFQTKEEIFIALLLDDLQGLFGELEALFRRAKGSRRKKVAAFLEVYAAALKKRPELPLLDAMCQSVLEKNLTPERLREFKLSSAAGLAGTARALEACMGVEEGAGVPLLMRTFAMTKGLWQTSRHAGETLEELESLCPDFDQELQEALTEYWRGALAGR